MAGITISELFCLLCIFTCLTVAKGSPSDLQSDSWRADSSFHTAATTVPASLLESVSITKSSLGTHKNEALTNFLSSHNVNIKTNRSLALVDLIGTSYIAHVTVGTKTVPLLIDTGSSDIWIAPGNFICLDADSRATEQHACGFPSFVEDTFSGGVVPDAYLSIIYGNGQFAHGPYGLESVSLGGITVPKQQIALLSEGYIEVASGDFAGILGLGYPGMVAARAGKKPKPYVNNTDPMAAYDTWFINAVKQNLTAPLFSMALNMNGGGLLAIGGIVDVPVNGNFAVTPILLLNLINDTRADTELTYYTIIAEDYLINDERFSKLSADADNPSGRLFPVIVDSGFTTSPLPPSLVMLFYGAFSNAPYPVEIEGHSMFAAPCDTAVIPTFGVQIAGQTFEMTKETLLVSRMNMTENGTLMCALGLQPGIEEAGLLGDTFLSNVVAVFDVGESEMRFAQRSYEVNLGQEQFGSNVKGVKDEL